MRFSPGDRVQVTNLGKGIVRAARNADRYVVEIKGRAIVVEGAQLTRVEGGKQRRDSNTRPRQTSNAGALARTHARSSIDLHGLTRDEATAALDEFINDAFLAGLPQVLVVHGRSGGRLKAAVHARLRELPVRHYRLDPSNPGVTIVEL